MFIENQEQMVQCYGKEELLDKIIVWFCQGMN